MGRAERARGAVMGSGWVSPHRELATLGHRLRRDADDRTSVRRAARRLRPGRPEGERALAGAAVRECGAGTRVHG